MAVAERWRARGTAAYAMYRAASRVVSPLVYLLVRWRRLRGLEHRVRWRERLGEPSAPRPAPGTPLLWFHAVSLGEGLAAIPVIRHCVQKRPDIAVLMTVSTVSAFEVIKERLPSSVIYQFAPLDTSAAVDKFLGYWNPDAVFLIESELWPNLIFSSAEKGIPLALLNARMSVKSFKLWSKPLAWSLISLMLSKFSLIAPLSTVEAIRFQLLLAPPFIINFGGDLKYAVGDFDVPQKELTILEDLKLQVASRRVWMASSIHYGEEEVVLQVHRELVKIYSNLVTIIVPRHPLHGRQIARALKQQEISVALRSNVERISPGTVIYIVDTLGELRTLYRITPIAVIGGSFLPELSGHNLSEAAAAGCAVLTGPFVGHFSHMIRQMTTSERLSVWQVSGREELEEALKQLLGDAGALEARRRAAKQAFSAVSGGVVGRVWELITAHILREPPQKALESFCLSPDAAGEGRGGGGAGRRAVSEEENFANALTGRWRRLFCSLGRRKSAPLLQTCPIGSVEAILPVTTINVATAVMTGYPTKVKESSLCQNPTSAKCVIFSPRANGTQKLGENMKDLIPRSPRGRKNLVCAAHVNDGGCGAALCSSSRATSLPLISL